MEDYDIFFSYRRLDAQGRISGRDIARLLSKEFKFYGYNTFFDYSELKDNSFADIILPAIENCKVFVLVLTKDSLDRCINEDDWVRKEISTAIKHNIKIVPINPNKSFDSWPINLPSEISIIKGIQISSIDMNENFEVTVKSVIDNRVAPIIPSQIKVNRLNDNSNTISFKIYDKIFEMPDQFFCNEVYKTLNRSYNE